MSEDFDRDNRCSRKKNIGNKNKSKKYNDFYEDQKFASKAKKAFKNKIRDIQDEEIMEELDNYE